MAEQRVELTTGELAGRHVVVARKRLTGGFLEDMQSGEAALILDALSRAIVGGDLPGWTDPEKLRETLRELPVDELGIVAEAVAGCVKVPKRGAEGIRQVGRGAAERGGRAAGDAV